MTARQLSVADIGAWLRAQYAGDRRQRDMHLDSRRINAGDVFIAVPGTRADGRDFIDAVARRGAAAVLVEQDGWEAMRGAVHAALPLLPVAGLARLAGPLAADFYGQPSQSLLAVGVTGTNGKTSCSQWVAQLLTRAGTRCAVIGTVGSGFPGATLDSTDLTTPDAVSLQRMLRRLCDDGARALAMEASSIGLDQGRVDGMHFDIALFTNLTRDHLDYHGTMAQYEAAKARLFDWPTLTHAVLNLDDAAGQRLAQRLHGRAGDGLAIIGYGLDAAAAAPALAHRLLARAVRSTAAGLAFSVDCDGASYAVEVPLCGTFNVANLLGVIGCALAAGLSCAAACDGVPHLVAPPGRMQRVGGDGVPLAVIDYAHTPDALAQALAALRPLATARAGRLWVVFGAGGDRDPGKRAPMGEAAARGADRLVITSDNPRSEAPQAIVAAVAAGVGAAVACERIVDRAEAIGHALAAADARDVVLIAGKGHEDYQDSGGRKAPFSDVAQARIALARRTAGGSGAAAGRAQERAA